MGSKEQVEQLGIADDGGIITDAHGFGMPGAPRADGLIAGIRHAPANIAGFDMEHALYGLKHRLSTPEAAASECRLGRGSGNGHGDTPGWPLWFLRNDEAQRRKEGAVSGRGEKLLPTPLPGAHQGVLFSTGLRC